MQNDKLKKTGKDSLQTVFENINNKIKMNLEMGNCVNEELNADSFFSCQRWHLPYVHCICLSGEIFIIIWATFMQYHFIIQVHVTICTDLFNFAFSWQSLFLHGKVLLPVNSSSWCLWQLLAHSYIGGFEKNLV